METLNDEGQWIVMMGFIVAIGMFMLAIIISQAPLVGQTTAESVMEFPKNEVQDLRGKLISMGSTLPEISQTTPDSDQENLQNRLANMLSNGDFATIGKIRTDNLGRPTAFIDAGASTTSISISPCVPKKKA